MSREELARFGNALRDYLGLKPLWKDGRDRRSREETEEEREMRRFYVAPFTVSVPSRKPAAP
jgi:hypothetical protein